MRTEPTEKYADREAHRKKTIDKVTRILALILGFVSTYFFFVKLLFL